MCQPSSPYRCIALIRDVFVQFVDFLRCYAVHGLFCQSLMQVSMWVRLNFLVSVAIFAAEARVHLDDAARLEGARQTIDEGLDNCREVDMYRK